ncbi:DUF5682 family protein [Mycobacterium sp. MYCO198283]|uniref:DUF5682 family protein n=1 Tax=Mycobacterium sp. MYCO198283 TaxID=2883505 RepID=UPI001E5DD636|nr:DUF5682 family protein [Mycobacterium sp. MYCO198283]MCG5434107.1 DUF5682 family protein [Mycobacterium sp. MYCO198283]
MPTGAEVRALAAALVTDELVVIPVRHHSPACAWQVRRAIADLSPAQVLVEGPRSFDPLIGELLAPQARNPLAFYTYAADAAVRHSGYYPFCDYSPEFVAFADAAARGIPAAFIDLDFTEQVALGRRRVADDAESLLDERRYAHSRGLDLLAHRLGCRDHEDLWELLFEAQAADTTLADHVAAMAAYCGQARDDTPAGELDADGTTAREAEMTWHIREALARRDPAAGPVLVVVGGFHAVVLPALVADPPKRPKIRARFRHQGTALIRYSFDRLERLNGYAAGMTSPAWQQRQWEALTRRNRTAPRVDATLAALLDVSARLRRGGHPVPEPTVAAAFEAALLLSGLRRRPAPLRSDLVDAITSTVVKGAIDLEGAAVTAAVRAVLTGDRIGTAPPGAATPPLVADTLERLAQQKLKIDSPQPRSLHLDIYRKPAHRVTSRLLHGLTLLGVPFAVCTGGPDYVNGRDLGRVQERWEYRWLPATEGALTEAAGYGVTLPEAVARRFSKVVEEFEASTEHRDACAACALLVQAAVLGLHERAAEALPAVTSAVVSDPSFPGMAQACSQLAMLVDAREALEAQRLTAVPSLLATAYRRALYLGSDCGGVDPAEVTEALLRLHEVLAATTDLDVGAAAYWGLVERLRTGHPAARVRGAALGLQYTAGRLSADEVAATVRGHLAGTVAPDEAIGFLHGVVQTCREIVWQEPVLVAALDERLGGWDDDTFLAHLPQLRLAFADLTPSEIDRVAAVVAGRGDGPPIVRRPPGNTDAALHVAASRDAVELLARDGLDRWAAPA